MSISAWLCACMSFRPSSLGSVNAGRFGGAVVEVDTEAVVDVVDDAVVAPATAGAPKTSAAAHTAAPARPMKNIPIQVGILPPDLQVRAPSSTHAIDARIATLRQTLGVRRPATRLPGGI